MKRPYLVAVSLIMTMLPISVGYAVSDGSGDSAAVKTEDGKYYDENGTPTYHVSADGTVDWFTYSGFRRYHSDCHVCHGPDGEGSAYAPALAHSLQSISYSVFLEKVASGSKKVMPAFGANRNVMCYIDDIFVYLRARGNEAISRGRPQKHADKPKSAQLAETVCMEPER